MKEEMTLTHGAEGTIDPDPIFAVPRYQEVIAGCEEIRLPRVFDSRDLLIF